MGALELKQSIFKICLIFLKTSNLSGIRAVEWNPKTCWMKSNKVRKLELILQPIGLILFTIFFFRLIDIRSNNEGQVYISSAMLFFGIVNGVAHVFTGFWEKYNIAYFYNVIARNHVLCENTEAKDQFMKGLHGCITMKEFQKLSLLGIKKSLLGHVRYGVPLVTAMCAIVSPPLLGIFITGALILQPCLLTGLLRSTIAKDCPYVGGYIYLHNPAFVPVVTILDIFLYFIYFEYGVYGIGLLMYLPMVFIRIEMDRLLEVLKKVKGKIGLQKTIGGFKEIMVLTSVYNGYSKSVISPVVIFSVIGMSVTALYAVIKLNDVLPINMLFFSIIFALETTVLAQMFFFSVGGDINDLSVQISKTWGSSVLLRRDKHLMRQIRALRPMKIQIGTGGNYFDKLTSLVTIQFSIEQAISLVLASGN